MSVTSPKTLGAEVPDVEVPDVDVKAVPDLTDAAAGALTGANLVAQRSRR